MRFRRVPPMFASCGRSRETFLQWVIRIRQVWRREGKRALLRTILKLSPQYEAWIAQNEPGPRQLAEQESAAKALVVRPLISIVVSVRGTTPQWLEASIRSVVDQSYDCWELDLVEWLSEDDPVKVVLEAWAARDSRVRIHRANASTRPPLFQRGQGDFVMLLKAGDTLAVNTLFEVAALLNRCADADMIYFDEDKISEDGRTRFGPFFKPDWSPELLCSVNYLAHAVVRRRLLDESPASSERPEETYAWDATLRCTEHARAIVHIPKVLYHQRNITGIPGSSSDALSASEDQRRCLAEHLQRLGVAGARVILADAGVVRVTWPHTGVKVSIIIPNKDRAFILQRCIISLMERTTYRNFEILIVDTGSTDQATRDYYATLAVYPQIRILDHPGPFNYSKTNNAGAKRTIGRILLFLNNDTEAKDPDWLDEMIRWAERPEIGVVGAKLFYPDGAIQHAGVIIGMDGLAARVYDHVNDTYTGIFGSVDWYRNYMAVIGACMMMRRDVFEEVRGFDEAYELAASDIEICLRVVKHGYRVVYTPFARLLHDGGATRGHTNPPSDIRRAIAHMKDLVESGDPYFNPNLSYESPIPMLPRWGDRSRAALLKRLIARTPMS